MYLPLFDLNREFKTRRPLEWYFIFFKNEFIFRNISGKAGGHIKTAPLCKTLCVQQIWCISVLACSTLYIQLVIQLFSFNKESEIAPPQLVTQITNYLLNLIS